ncbi:MAG: UDP-N-acetylmuramoyl-L-alanine--D-glutamate ligase, partial [Chloroflexi bacterium]|nr:UDP-N-acetylmuramoyl-L-alanine--D-glutamate ligase [Chloroflexota bacterium]
AAIDLPSDAMRVAVERFEGVEHRLEFVRSWGGADGYNDSIATAPERAIAAMKSFDAPLALLAGGQDKDLPWDEFAAEVRARVHHLIAFGEAADLVIDAVGQAGSGEMPYSVTRCEGLAQAVEAAVEVVNAGDVVLLSPGGTSYDEFIDFEERGEKFKEWVQAL